MMELVGIKQGKNESLRDFVKQYHRTVLDLGAFNHLQALKGLNEEIKIGQMWFNLRNLAIQNCSIGYG